MAGQIIQEVFCLAVSVNFACLDIADVVTGTFEGDEKRNVLRIGFDEQVADPCAEYLMSGVVAIHARHRIVTFGKICELKKKGELLVVAQRHRDRLFELKSPDPSELFAIKAL